jgi:fatty acid desaturase
MPTALKLTTQRPQGRRRQAGPPSDLRAATDDQAEGSGAPTELRRARWFALLIAVVMVAVVGLSSAAVFGAAAGAWWPLVLGAVFVGVVLLALVVLRESS